MFVGELWTHSASFGEVAVGEKCVEAAYRVSVSHAREYKAQHFHSFLGLKSEVIVARAGG